MRESPPRKPKGTKFPQPMAETQYSLPVKLPCGAGSHFRTSGYLGPSPRGVTPDKRSEPLMMVRAGSASGPEAASREEVPGRTTMTCRHHGLRIDPRQRGNRLA